MSKVNLRGPRQECPCSHLRYQLRLRWRRPPFRRMPHVVVAADMARRRVTSKDNDAPRHPLQLGSLWARPLSYGCHAREIQSFRGSGRIYKLNYWT